MHSQERWDEYAPFQEKIFYRCISFPGFYQGETHHIMYIRQRNYTIYIIFVWVGGSTSRPVVFCGPRTDYLWLTNGRYGGT